MSNGKFKKSTDLSKLSTYDRQNLRSFRLILWQKRDMSILFGSEVFYLKRNSSFIILVLFMFGGVFYMVTEQALVQRVNSWIIVPVQPFINFISICFGLQAFQMHLSFCGGKLNAMLFILN